MSRGGQKDAEGDEHRASQDIGGTMVPEVQCRKDHEVDRREHGSQARRERMSWTLIVTLDSLQGESGPQNESVG
jgi:hypothetical protein